MEVIISFNIGLFIGIIMGMFFTIMYLTDDEE